MAVKIRLKRMGKKKQPVYRVVVVDSRKARDGSYIEALGFYDPRQEPSVVEVENDKAVDWLSKGAQPTEAARKLLEISGAWTQFKIAKGEVHTIGADATETEEAPAEEPSEAAVEADVEVEAEADAEAEVAEADSDEPVAEEAPEAAEEDAAEEDAAEASDDSDEDK